MPAPHVSQAILKRLEKLDGPLRDSQSRAAYAVAMTGGRVCDEQLAEFTKAQRTILGIPRIMSLSAFEAIAGPSQDKLIQSGLEDCSRREPIR